jgi:hypothetical protein
MPAECEKAADRTFMPWDRFEPRADPSIGAVTLKREDQARTTLIGGKRESS